eukprot:CAMPEP_0203863658 /NCGR_PEP_ID=MMETSP0359-20131031/14295_1 /ASSEMBLY_ACC=CAM_ASM_000338 /TAXON_ID=268821 /ORGANISM="Scrippsiella Hangoei, Strain SHTV-5" /LENGTH=253 /DNA_ID=CAMNT_0050781245 /DNA_START=667 /DNA_END=1426 /DNA_ORIENTATION=+
MDSLARQCEAPSLGKHKRQRLADVLLGQRDVRVVELEHVSALELRVVGKEPPIGPTIGALLGTHFRALLRQPLHNDPMPIQLGSPRELRCSIHDEKAVAPLREWPDVVIKADFVVQVAIVGATDQVAPPRSGSLAEDSPVSKMVVVVNDVVEVGLALAPEICQRQHRSSSNLWEIVAFGVDGDIDVFLADVPAHPTQVLRECAKTNSVLSAFPSTAQVRTDPRDSARASRLMPLETFMAALAKMIALSAWAGW